jgi:hypothetical protein
MTWIFLPPSPGEDDVEFGLFFGGLGGSAATGRSRGNRDGGGGGNAPRLFEGLGKVSRLEDGQLRQFFNKLGDIGHDASLLDVWPGRKPRKIV